MAVARSHPISTKAELLSEFKTFVNAGQENEAFELVAQHQNLIDDIANFLPICNNDDQRLQVLLACKNKITPDQFGQLIHFLDYAIYRLRFALEMRATQNCARISILVQHLIPTARPEITPLDPRQLVETEELKALIKKERESLVTVIQLFPRAERITFLKLFSPAFLMEFINSWQDWHVLQQQCDGSADKVAPCFGLRVSRWYQEPIEFQIAMKNLTSVCSDTQYPEHLRKAGQEVVRAFEEAYQADALNTTKKLKQFKEVAELVAAVISSNGQNTQPLLDKLKADPIQLGDVTIERRVGCALALFFCAALVTASITLALISFGVLAPLTIATITLSANLLTACLATAAAPVAFGLGITAVFFYHKKQGPALAADEFVAQQKAAKP